MCYFHLKERETILSRKMLEIKFQIIFSSVYFLISLLIVDLKGLLSFCEWLSVQKEVPQEKLK